MLSVLILVSAYEKVATLILETSWDQVLGANNGLDIFKI